MTTNLLQLEPSFDSLTAAERIALVMWFQHIQGDLPTLTNSSIRQCFRDMHAEPPDITVYLPRMAAKKPPIVVKVRGGYRLEGSYRRLLDGKYLPHPTSIAVAQTLASLPDKVPSLSEKTYLSETISCYRVGAFRASTVMAWNLAFDHVRSWVFADPSRLAVFNNGLATKYPKKAVKMASLEDFDELKESEFIEICRTARLLNKNVCDILREKLSRRNAAAHPSEIVVTQSQADDTIIDLVHNVILSLI